MYGDGAIEAVRRLVAETPGLADLLGRLLDRREAAGRLPSRFRCEATAPCVAALRAIFSSRSVVPLPDGRVRLDLGGVSPEHADTLLYTALGRAPRDPAAEEVRLRRSLDDALGAAERRARSPAARTFLAAERAAGDLLALARSGGVEAAAFEAGCLVDCIDAAVANAVPVRLANFAARVLGGSKMLVFGSDRYWRLGAALYQHDPVTRADVHLGGEPVSPRDAWVRALEARGLVRDETAASALCFGPLVYAKHGLRFDEVARHARLGDICRLTLAQLRGAALATEDIERVTVIENRTPFLDYADRAGPGELVVASDGQASWAVVALLRLVAHLPVPMRHTGDLDRSGVLILRSLRRRSGAPLTPLAMDVATHRRFRDRGRPVAGDELRRVHALVGADTEGEIGHDLLVEIATSGIWIEQEAFGEDALVAEGLGHGSIHNSGG